MKVSKHPCPHAPRFSWFALARAQVMALVFLCGTWSWSGVKPWVEKYTSFAKYSVEEGLSQATVYAMVQDRLGFLWIGTQYGLNRFDGYEFRVFQFEASDPNSISGNVISQLLLDRDGQIWVGTLGSGLNRFDHHSQTFVRYRNRPGQTGTISSDTIYALAQDRDGAIWVGTEDGLNRFQPETGVWTRFGEESNSSQGLPHTGIRALAVDSENQLWIGTDQGLAMLNSERTRFRQWQAAVPADSTSLVHNQISSLYWKEDQLFIGTHAGLSVLQPKSGLFHNYIRDQEQEAPFDINQVLADHEGHLWLASAAGLLKLDPHTGHFTRFRNAVEDPKSIAEDVITCLLEDKSELMWVGTESSGLAKVSPYSSSMIHIRPGHGPNPLPNGVIICFFVDEKDRFWITSSGGGLFRFDPETGRFFDQALSDPARPTETPSDDNLWSIDEDSRGRLWIASQNGLNRFEPETGVWKHYQNETSDPTSLAFNKCFSAHVDERDRVWVATFGGGVSRLDPETDQFTHYPFDARDPHSLSSGVTLYVDQDQVGRTWVGTYGSGLNLYRPETDDFQVFKNDPNDSRSLSSDVISGHYQDLKGRLWFATGRGISLYHEQTADFLSYSHKQGLVDDVTYAIVEDDDGLLWISTNRGLSRFDPEHETFFNLHVSQNLQSSEFNQLAGFKHEGLIYFGGINGFNIFDPRHLPKHDYPPPVVLTQFLKNNEPAALPVAIEVAETLDVGYQDTFLSFGLAALDFVDPEQNQFAYRLEGFHDSEIFLGKKHDIGISRLDPGHYTLTVRAANADGVWSQTSRVLKINVIPPFWRSGPAYALYLLLAVLAIGGGLTYQQKRIARAEVLNQRLQQVDRLKDEFLANTSTQLRKPLNGIIGIAETLRDDRFSASSLQENLELIISNGRRLDSIIMDLLDFSQMKHQSLVLSIHPLDVASLVDVILPAFAPLLVGKPVNLVQDFPEDLPLVDADESRLQQILFNLLDNAAKFTQEGEIRITAHAVGPRVEIEVYDSGVGIDPARHDALFQTFQSGSNDPSLLPGSGLGLAVTYQLVALHGGHLQFQSKLGVGSVFRFTLPVSLKQMVVERPPNGEAGGESAVVAESAALPEGSLDHRFHILIVDDERVNRHLLQNMLRKKGYQTTQLEDGTQALDLIDSGQRFDLVLLDIIMPRMNGYETCRRLRERYSLQELPVIFLTGKNQVADLRTGFEIGANDFLGKPFSKDELLARVQLHLSLLDTHRNLEALVGARTVELEKQYRELEALNGIVKTINQELQMEDLLMAVLQAALHLFPQAESGSILLKDSSRKYFRVAANINYPTHIAKQVRMSIEQTETRYKLGNAQLTEGIFIVENPPEATRPFEVKGLDPPKALLVMELVLQGETEGFLVLDHSRSETGFTILDARPLVYFREHIISAITRARILENLAQSQKDLVDAAHLFGMADNASMVLHNLGNKLNSVNTSVQVLRSKMAQEQWTPAMVRAQQLLSQPDQVSWLEDAQAQLFAKYLERLFDRASHWKAEQDNELGRLESHVNEVLLALRAQWDYTTIKGVPEPTNLTRLLQSCTNQGLDLRRHGIELVEQFREVPPVTVYKVKLMQVFFSLIENAIESITKAGATSGSRLTLRTYTKADFVFVEIEDNGVGIEAENLERLFSQGYSTKSANSSGFGLHNCANLISEMGGTLSILSDGPGTGACVTLSLPLVAEAN